MHHLHFWIVSSCSLLNGIPFNKARGHRTHNSSELLQISYMSDFGLKGHRMNKIKSTFNYTMFASEFKILFVPKRNVKPYPNSMAYGVDKLGENKKK
jgi:hypothetical protein